MQRGDAADVLDVGGDRKPTIEIKESEGRKFGVPGQTRVFCLGLGFQLSDSRDRHITDAGLRLW